MCGRFTTYTWDELLEVARSITLHAPFREEPDWPARLSIPELDIRPGMEAGVIIPAGASGLAGGTGTSALELTPLIWGFAAPWQSQPVINTRIESALEGKPFWRDAIANGRCIVPCHQYFEPHRDEKQRNARGSLVARQYAFRAQNEPFTLMAGVQQDGRFSVVTTAPNDIAASVHDRMPLAMTADEALTWLYGDWTDLANLADRSAFPLLAEPEHPQAFRDQLSLF